MGQTIGRLDDIEADIYAIENDIVPHEAIARIKNNVKHSRKDIANHMIGFAATFAGKNSDAMKQIVNYHAMAKYGAVKRIYTLISSDCDQEMLENMLAGACERVPSNSHLCNIIVLAGAYGCEECDDYLHPLIEHRVRYMLMKEICIGSDVNSLVIAYFIRVIAPEPA